MTTQSTPPHASGGLQGPRDRRTEITTKTLQIGLLTLGGLLLTSAVVVFTAVAWREMGDGGRLTVLAGFTGLLLAVPPVLTRFRLWATAETLAAIATLALWCSALAGYYLYLPTGAGLTAASVASWTTLVLIGAAGYRIAARVSAPGWALLPLAAAGASFAAVADAFAAALHMVLIGAVLAGTAWTVRALPSRHTHSDQWSARALLCAAGVTVFLGGLRAAFGLDTSAVAIAAAGLCLLASVGVLATVHTHREGASKAAVAIGASATGMLVVAACVLASRSSEPVLAVPVFLLLAVVITAVVAMGDADGPSELSLTASALSGIVSIGTLGVVLTDAYELTSFFGATALALALARAFPGPLRSALRWAAALTGTAVLGWCSALALSALPLAFGSAPVPLLTWEIPAVTMACAVGLPLAPASLRREAAAVLASVSVLAAGGLLDAVWTSSVSLGALALIALAIALTARRAALRCAGWVATYVWAAIAVAAARYGDLGGADPALFAFVGAVTGSALLVVALTVPADGGPGRAVSLTGAHLFTGASLLWSLAVFGSASLWDGQRLSVFVPMGFTAYGASLAVAAWTARAHRVGHVLGSFGAVTAAYLLLTARGAVSGLEYYTVPPSLLLLGIGLWLLRRDPARGSWAALGPALAVGFAPSLALSFGPDGEPLRRVLVGAAALAVLLLAASRRWQAPLVIGAAALAALSVNEMVLLWSLVPKWIPLAVGGAVLIVAGATLEQRRRDLARLSGSVKAMR